MLKRWVLCLVPVSCNSVQQEIIQQQKKNSWVLYARREHAKKVSIMFSASLMQLGTTRNYIAVEEKFLGFVLVYELACTPLHGSSSFVERIDPFSAINRHDLTAIRSAHTVNRNFEFLCVVQTQRSIAVHNRKLKSRGINLIYLTSCRKVVAYRFGGIFLDQNKYSDY